jgi:dTDP-4-dehydrorhamnose reductase
MEYLERAMAVIIIGTNGMLGSMMRYVIPDAIELNRPEFDAEEVIKWGSVFEKRVINCAGVIKPYCNDVARAVKVNALFPYYLPPGTIQIATDCVYTGKKGNYVETDPHDALDVYGKTKSLGEAAHLINLRCSIIGPEINSHLSLLDWFLAQKSEVSGFSNHFWNGVTTYHFAKIVKGILGTKKKLPILQHIVPTGVVTKAELLQILAEEFNHDININKQHKRS